MVALLLSLQARSWASNHLLVILPYCSSLQAMATTVWASMVVRFLQQCTHLDQYTCLPDRRILQTVHK